jgi:hypothetical protein
MLQFPLRKKSRDAGAAAAGTRLEHVAARVRRGEGGLQRANFLVRGNIGGSSQLRRGLLWRSHTLGGRAAGLQGFQLLLQLRHFAALLLRKGWAGAGDGGEGGAWPHLQLQPQRSSFRPRRIIRRFLAIGAARRLAVLGLQHVIEALLSIASVVTMLHRELAAGRCSGRRQGADG